MLSADPALSGFFFRKATQVGLSFPFSHFSAGHDLRRSKVLTMNVVGCRDVNFGDQISQRSEQPVLLMGEAE
jgi:hypothetical protein